MKNNYEATTDPIPRHPESFSLEALKDKMAAAAMERVSGFDVNPTRPIPVRDESAGQEQIPITPRDYTEEEKRQLAASEIRARAMRPAPWIRKLQ